MAATTPLCPFSHPSNFLCPCYFSTFLTFFSHPSSPWTGSPPSSLPPFIPLTSTWPSLPFQRSAFINPAPDLPLCTLLPKPTGLSVSPPLLSSSPVWFPPPLTLLTFWLWFCIFNEQFFLCIERWCPYGLKALAPPLVLNLFSPQLADPFLPWMHQCLTTLLYPPFFSSFLPSSVYFFANPHFPPPHLHLLPWLQEMMLSPMTHSSPALVLETCFHLPTLFAFTPFLCPFYYYGLFIFPNSSL